MEPRARFLHPAPTLLEDDVLNSLPLGGPVRFLAIVVGIGSQDDARIPATPNARRDASLARRLLLESGLVQPDDMLLLTDGDTGGEGVAGRLEPTLENLRYALDEWLGAHFSVGDVVIVYYAGQGGYVVDEAHRATPYFIPRDAMADRLAGTALDAHWVVSQLGSLSASQLVLCYDTSFGGRGFQWQPEIDWSELHRLNGRDDRFPSPGPEWRLSIDSHGVVLGPDLDHRPTPEGRGCHGVVTLALARALHVGNDTWYGLGVMCRHNDVELSISYRSSKRLLPHLLVRPEGGYSPTVRDVTRLDRVLRVGVPDKPHTLAAIVGPLHEDKCKHTTAVIVDGLLGAGVAVDLPLARDKVEGTALDDSGEWAAVLTCDGITACHLLSATFTALPLQEIVAICFLPRHQSIGMRSSDHLQLWHLVTGAVTPVGLPVERWDCEVAFSPDGRLAASAHDGPVSICDLESGQVREMRGRRIYARSVGFSADGSNVVGAGGGRASYGVPDVDGLEIAGDEVWGTGPIQTWDLNSGMSTSTLRVEAWDEKPSIHGGVGFSPDGRSVVALDSEHESELILWSTRTGRQRAIPEAVSRLTPGWDFPFGGQWAFSPNGRVLIVVQDSVHVCFYDAARLRLIASAVFLHQGRDWFVATPEGRYDASPGAASEIEWRCGRDALPLESLAERRLPGLLGLLVDGRLPPRGAVALVSPKTVPRRLARAVPSMSAGTSPRANAIGASSEWSALFKREVPLVDPGQGGIVVTIPPSRVLVASSTRVQVWECLGEPCPLTLELPLPEGQRVDDCIVAAAVSPDANWFAVATAGGWLSIGRFSDASWVAHPLRLDGFRPVSLSFRSDALVLAMGGHDGDLALCDLRPWLRPFEHDATVPAPIYVQLGPANEAMAVEVCFSEGKLLATLGDRLLVLDGGTLARLQSHPIPTELRWDLVSPRTSLNPDTGRVRNGAAVWPGAEQVILQDFAFATGHDGHRRALSTGRDPMRIESQQGRVVEVPLEAAPPASWRRPVIFMDSQQLLTLEGTGGKWGMGVWDVDGRRLALLEDPQSIFTEGGGQPPRDNSHVARLTCVAADKGGHTLVVGVKGGQRAPTRFDATQGRWRPDPLGDVPRSDGVLTVWDTTPWGGIVSRPPAAEGEVPAVVAAARRRVLHAYPDGNVIAQSWLGGSAVAWQAHSTKIVHMEISEDEEHALTVGDGLKVKYWRLADAQLVWEVEAEPGADTRSCWVRRDWQRTARLLAGSAGVVTACAARGVVRHLFACGDGEGEALLSVAPTPGPVLATSPCGSWLGAAVGLNTPLLWHLPSGELRSLRGFAPEDFDRMSFSPDSRWLAASGSWGSSSDRFSLTVWGVASGDVALRLWSDERILCTSFTPDGRVLIVADARGVQFRGMPSGQLLATACCLNLPHRPWVVLTPGGEMDAVPYRMHPPARRVAHSLPIQGLLGGLALPGLLGRILAGESW